MAIDDRGRLWVAEAYTYPIRAPEGKGKDRILIFEDTDGDGRFEKPQGLRRKAEPGQRPGSRLRRRVGRRGAVLAVHPRSRRRRQARRPAGGAARRLGLRGHARNAQHVHLGPRRLALRLPRRVHALERRQAGHARRRAHADQRRHLALSSHAARVRSLRPRHEQSLGRRFRRPRPGVLPRPASSRTCITSFRAAATSGRRASTSIRTPTTTSRRSPTTGTGSATRPTRATAARTPPAAAMPMPAR